MKEIFIDIVGYEGLYKVSNFGRIKILSKSIKHKDGGYSIRNEKVVNGIKQHNGYMRVVLNKNGVRESITVHKLVLSAFSKNTLNKPFINHINGIKSNNRIENLEWCTSSENHKHAFKIGLKNQVGEKNNGSKLTESDVINIKSLLGADIPKTKIAKMFNVSSSTIININKGLVWSHVTKTA